jgi:transposase
MKTENIRLEEFRQLRNQIRGSKTYLIVGIDIAKQKHNAFFGTSTGKTLFKRLVFDNSKEGFEKLLTQQEALRVQNNLSQVVMGVEPTGNYHKPLAEYLIESGYQVVLVSGVAVKRNRELLDGRWDKNDSKDSANIADLISQGKCQFYEHPNINIRELRNQLSLKKRFKKQEHGLRVRIRNNLLAQYFPEMDQYFKSCESENLAIVNHSLAPDIIARLEYNEFFNMVTTRKTGLRQHKHLYKIWQAAAQSIGCEAAEATLFEAGLVVKHLQEVRSCIRSIDSQIADICSQIPEYAYLLTIPGFGPDVSSKVIAAIGNPFRFDKSSQVIKTSGYDLSANRSGKNSDKVVPVISKKGKAGLRYALYQAALVASTKNQHFMKYFTKIIRGREGERGIKTKMRVKLAAKLLVIAWTLMKNKEPFNPDYLQVK